MPSTALGQQLRTAIRKDDQAALRERLEVLLSRLADGQNADGHAAVGGHAYAGYSWGAFEWIDSLLKCAERYGAADATKILAAKRRQLEHQRRRVPRRGVELERRAAIPYRRAVRASPSPPSVSVSELLRLCRERSGTKAKVVAVIARPDLTEAQKMSEIQRIVRGR